MWSAPDHRPPDPPPPLFRPTISEGDQGKEVRGMYSNMYEDMKNIGKEFSKDSGLVHKLELLDHTKFVEKMISALKPKEDSFNCLNHGDAWCNNFMFKYVLLPLHLS
jgi:hypothetical protein